MSAARIEIATTDPRGTTFTINPEVFRVEIRRVNDQIEIRMIPQKTGSGEKILVDNSLMSNQTSDDM